MGDNTIDQILQAEGLRNIGNTPSLNINDNKSSANFYDYVLNSIEDHNQKLNKSFSDLEFMGMLLYTQQLTLEDLKERTSPAFVSRVLGKSKISAPPGSQTSNLTLHQMYVHIPEISGLLPKPTVGELMLPPLRETDEEKLLLKIVRRFPKFYFASSHRIDFNPMDIVKVKFVDENFMYYGLFQERLLNGRQVFFNNVLGIA
tara:strand:+ start:2404 stop:3009 length:606 start_codon:yes stop_codon:yes gene_type:complete